MIRTEPTSTPPLTETLFCQSAAAVSTGGSGGHSAALLPVIFFDGVCGLCNAWVDFVMARDRQRRFHFSPLQGETARDWLQMTPDSPLDSVTLADAAGIHRKSDAVWRILVQLGGGWSLAGRLLRLVPRPVRNWGYDFVARHRYRWFGKKESCRLPNAVERERFLP
jgi:predicted DCC family thiol-disulfide oxidoreductase YuxK